MHATGTEGSADGIGTLEPGTTLTSDPSEHEARDGALHAAEDAKYRALYENCNDAVLLTRPSDGAVLSANPAACRLFGYSEQELRGLARDTLVDTGDPKFEQAWTERSELGAVAAELTFLHKGGSSFQARISSRLFRDASGAELACSNVHDITGRKQTEEALRHSEERFRLVFENAPVGICLIDHDGLLTAANKKFLEIVGYSEDEVIGFAHPDTALPEMREYSEQVTRQLLSGELSSLQIENPLLRKDGSTIWVRSTIRVVPDVARHATKGIVLYEDITERKAAKDALRHSEQKFRTTFQNAPIGIAECSIEGKFLEVNAKLVEILGYSREELSNLTVLDVTHPGDLERSRVNFDQLVAGEAQSYSIEKRYLRKDRSIVWINGTASISAIPGEPPRLVVAVEDITARKRAEEDLKQAIAVSYHQANHDQLTGLANRSAYNDRLRQALAYAKRDQHLVAIHVLDLDGFKSINDTLGHHVGDLLLREVALRIQAQVRGTDLAARLGGDEFVVIQTLLAESAGAGILAARLQDELSRPYMLEGQHVHSGVSIGIALYPDDADTAEVLMKHADLALYDAKHRGRFNYQFYRQELGAAFRKAQQLGQELVAALHGNQLCLHYQPQFDAKRGRMTGLEALLRWQHPTRGNLSAGAFIQEAERLRLMPAIGRWSVETACRQYKEWIELGLAVPLTLNLSLMELRDPQLLQTLQRILDETEVPASLVQLEMRESMLWDPKFSTTVLNQMKDTGFRLALDEVGVELTMLPTLSKFPLDAVKPGQRLVRRMSSQQRETIMLDAIVGIAHNLNLAVCADGVETEGQLAVVKAQGFDSVQGNLLSWPLSTDQMQHLIERELAS